MVSGMNRYGSPGEFPAGKLEEVWRVGFPGRIFAALLTLFLLLLAVGGLIDDLSDWVWAALLISVPSLVAWRLAFAPRLEIHEGVIRVVNPLRTREIAFAEVKDVSPGYDGIRIERLRGWAITVWAVQESNFKAIGNRESRAKRVTHRLREVCGLEEKL